MKIVSNHTTASAFQVGFEWDQNKYQQTLDKRQISFIDATELFEIDNRFTYLSPYPGNDEERFVTVGLLKNKLFTVIYTFRQGNIRIITARRAHDREERIYNSLFG